ncbi:MAG: MCE family protein [Pseudonocardiaceae bacterium]|nr:MCE family protein [Pseudonocardiaceae bacterium]
MRVGTRRVGAGIRVALDSSTRIAAVALVIALVAATAVWLVLRDGQRTVTAYFERTTAVYEGNDVRVLGVPVGSVASLDPQGDVVRVELALDDDVAVPAGVQAVVVTPSIVTGRYVQLTPAYSGGPQLADGGVIPRERTAVPLEFDDLARQTNRLATALGPEGANAQGELSDLLDVSAQNLEGNGQALADTIENLGEANRTLAGSREDLFGTIGNLQTFTTMLSDNDDEVRRFNTQLADISGFLAGEREDLGAAVEQLSIALGDVSVFIEDNRAILGSNVDRLTEVTEVLVRQREALAEIGDVAPAALGNLNNAYDADTGTLATRGNINELALPPMQLACELAARGTPEQVPPTLTDLCTRLEPEVSGAVPAPSLAEVITSLEEGEPPPMGGLAVPRVPEGDR